MSADNSTLVSGSQDGAVIVWILSTKVKHGSDLDAHGGGVNALAFCPADIAMFSPVPAAILAYGRG